MSDFAHLVTPKNFVSGISDNIWIAPFTWFRPGGIKSPAPGEIIIEDDYVFNPGKGFVKLQLAPRKNQYAAKTQGELALNNFGHELTIFIPGSYAELHEQAQYLLNIPFIVLFYDSNCPIEFVYSLGNENVGCWFSLDFSTGFTHEGTKGFLGTIRTDNRSVVLYEGLINEVPVDDLLITDEQGNPMLAEDGSNLLIE